MKGVSKISSLLHKFFTSVQLKKHERSNIFLHENYTFSVVVKKPNLFSKLLTTTIFLRHK